MLYSILLSNLTRSLQSRRVANDLEWILLHACKLCFDASTTGGEVRQFPSLPTTHLRFGLALYENRQNRLKFQ